MSIREVRTFLAVVKSGSFAAAAASVRRTQSAVTVQIRSLEDEVGFELFDRSKRPPVLNDAGRAFVAKATAAVEAYDRMFQTGKGRSIQGHLRVGVVPSVITGIMPCALVALRANFPCLHVQLSMGLSADLVERVRQGDLDAAIVSDLMYVSSGLEWFPFLRELLVLIAPPEAPCHRAEDLITKYPFIRYTRQAWVGELIDTYLKKRRLEVNEMMELDTLEAITTMVHHGLGVSVVPERSMTDSVVMPVRKVPFSGAKEYRTIGMVYLRDHAKAQLSEALLEELMALSKASPPNAVPKASK